MSQWRKNWARMTSAHKVVVVLYLALMPVLVLNLVLLVAFHSDVLQWTLYLLLPLNVALVVVLYRKSERDSAKAFVDGTIPPAESDIDPEGPR